MNYLKSHIKQIIKEEINSLILERYVNLIDKKEMTKYIDVIWDLLQRTYEPIGGFLAVNSKQELIDKTFLAKLVRKDNKIIAVKLYRDQLGKKSFGSGSDGSAEGKQAVKQMIIDDVKTKRAWGEFSGAVEKVYLKNGGTPIPNDMAEKILGKPIISKSEDGFHYTRDINGHEHEKILIGNLENIK